MTEGLDGLRERLAEYHKLGARFAKWRAVITIADGTPTWNCIKANAHALARYAALCQEAGIVPIVEPEVLMDGAHAGHDIDRCYEVTEWTQRTVFRELYDARVALEGIDPEAEHGHRRPEVRQAGERRAGRRAHREVPEGDGAGRRPRHRLPLRRPVGRAGDARTSR